MNRRRWLEKHLVELDREVARLLERRDEFDFWARFAVLAEELVGHCDPMDRAWLSARIDAVLSSHGVSESYPSL